MVIEGDGALDARRRRHGRHRPLRDPALAGCAGGVLLRDCRPNPGSARRQRLHGSENGLARCGIRRTRSPRRPHHPEAIMRIVLLLGALAFAMPTLAACTTANPNSRVYQTMNNQPNVCGKGFKRDIDAC